MGLASGPFVAAMVVGENNYGLLINLAVIALFFCGLVFVAPAALLDRTRS